jgi:hypothetical protein
VIVEVVLEVQDSIRGLTLHRVWEAVFIEVLKGSPGSISLGNIFENLTPLANHVSTNCGGS